MVGVGYREAGAALPGVAERGVAGAVAEVVRRQGRHEAESEAGVAVERGVEADGESGGRRRAEQFCRQDPVGAREVVEQPAVEGRERRHRAVGAERRVPLRCGLGADLREEWHGPVHRQVQRGRDARREAGVVVTLEPQHQVVGRDAVGVEHVFPRPPVEWRLRERLDDLAEQVPAAELGVGAVGAEAPAGRRLRGVDPALSAALGQDARQDRVDDVQPGGVTEHLLDGPLGDPRGRQVVDDVAEAVVEAELVLGDESEHRHRDRRLGGAVERRERRTLERVVQVGATDRRVEQELATPFDDDLRTGVEEPLVGLGLEAVDECFELGADGRFGVHPGDGTSPRGARNRRPNAEPA